MRMTIGNVVRTKILMVANYAAKDTRLIATRE